jgi:hypothetical protein
MTSEGAQRNPQSVAVTNSGMRLVYSRDWPVDRRRLALVQHVIQPSRVKQARQMHLVETRNLAAAALAAPLVWACHALLQFLHIL